MDMSDTIVALATARGRAGVAVIRLSGPVAWDACVRLAGDVPPERRASLRRLRDRSGELIDDALVLVFEAGHSFTGERVVEFQIHGSDAVVAALLRELAAIPGIRMAEAGEFTRRAFENGRLDLTQVEALADLLQAETEAQRRQAQRILDGTVARQIEAWRQGLLEALSLLEASLDFADEDLPADLLDLALSPVRKVREGLRNELAGSAASERIRDGFEVAIVGATNVGKSTLLNYLAGRDVAITSERAGTTRDVIEVRLDLNGLPVTLIDTAGLRETEDEIERMGMERGRERAAAADLRVYLRESGEKPLAPLDRQDIIVQAKADLGDGSGVSGKTGAGVEALIADISQRLVSRTHGSSIFSRQRHFASLRAAEQHLCRAEELIVERHESWEFVAEELRAAGRRLDGIIGRIDVEDVLGQIFSAFCIGK